MAGPAEAVCSLDSGHQTARACCGTDRGGKVRRWTAPVFRAEAPKCGRCGCPETEPADWCENAFHTRESLGLPERKPPRRIARPRNLTLTPAASAALDALMSRPGGDNASAEASAAILARAEAMGVTTAT